MIYGRSGRTSIRMEPELWAAFDEARQREGWTVEAASEVMLAAYPGASATSAVRAWLFTYFREAAEATWRLRGEDASGFQAVPGFEPTVSLEDQARLQRLLRRLQRGKTLNLVASATKDGEMEVRLGSKVLGAVEQIDEGGEKSWVVKLIVRAARLPVREEQS